MNPLLDRKFPSVFDIERAALKRIPKFIGEYIAYGMGRGGAIRNNRAALDRIKLSPRYNLRCPVPDMQCTLLGRSYSAPFGIAPVGLGGLAWPGAPERLAETALTESIPFVTATFALSTLEQLRKCSGDMGWFQLYLPNKTEAAEDLLSRAEQSGYENLIITVDIPAPMRRDHDIRNGFSVPIRFGPKTILDLFTHPKWSMAMAIYSVKHGFPLFENLMPYVPKGISNNQALSYMADITLGNIDARAMQWLRQKWKGKLIVKGVLDPTDALAYQDQGADAIVVSNHGGRQLEAAPSPVEVLPSIRKAVGPNLPLIADSGVRSGLDICRILACGADFVLIGRPIYYAMAAMGSAGADHIVELFTQELKCQMGQLGCATVTDIRDRLWTQQ